MMQYNVTVISADGDQEMSYQIPIMIGTNGEKQNSYNDIYEEENEESQNVSGVQFKLVQGLGDLTSPDRFD